MKPGKTALTILLCTMALSVTSLVSVTVGQSSGWTYVSANFHGEGLCVVQTSDGGYVVGGGVQAEDGGSIHPFLAKYNASGSMEWNQIYGNGTAEWGEVCAVVQTADSGFVIAGAGSAFNFAKTDYHGNIEWNRTLVCGSSRVFSGQSLARTEDGGYLVAGYTNSTPSDFVVKLDMDGALQWNKTLDVGEQNALWTAADRYFAASPLLSIVPASGGEYLVSGGAGIAKIASDGNVLWHKMDVGGKLIKTIDDAYLLMSSSVTMGYLTKIKASGAVEWRSAYTQASGQIGITFTDVSPTLDGGYVVCGWAGRHELKPFDFTMVLYYYAHVTKVNGAGNVQWSVLYEATRPPAQVMGNYPNSIKVTSDGAYVFTGRKAGYVWLVKLNDQTTPKPTTIATPLSVQSQTTSAPSNVSTATSPQIGNWSQTEMPQIQPLLALAVILVVVAAAGWLFTCGRLEVTLAEGQWSFDCGVPFSSSLKEPFNCENC